MRLQAIALSERREMGLDNVSDYVDIDAEILMYEDVAEASDLRQAISGCAPVISVGRWFTASPMICRLRSIASSAISNWSESLI